MHTCKANVLYITEKLQFFSLAIIISVDNQTLMIINHNQDEILKNTILKKNRVLLSYKCIITSIKLINHKISTILSVFNSLNHFNIRKNTSVRMSVFNSILMIKSRLMKGIL